MKTTDKHISTITEKQRQIHNDKCKDDYYKNQSKYQVVARMNYYKKKFGEDVISKFIDKYGYNLDCIHEIKKATKKTIQIDMESPSF